jgi:hypothetical protein
MSRKIFLIIAAILAGFFGAHMLLLPAKMLNNMATINTVEMQNVLQWGGTMLLSIALMNFLSRNDPGSLALRAVMIGNIFMHVIALIVDAYDYNIHFIRQGGLISGAIVHGLMITGFTYYLVKMKVA